MSSGSPSVLVVGAGPVGLVLACDLARRGVAIRVIDKLTGPTDESRAIIVHARSLEMMERTGGGRQPDRVGGSHRRGRVPRGRKGAGPGRTATRSTALTRSPSRPLRPTPSGCSPNGSPSSA